MLRWACVAALTIGCGSGEITVTPASLDFGVVDFNQANPGGGYNAVEWTVTNSGTRDLQPIIRGVDDERLTLAGRLEDSEPPWLQLPEGSVSVLTIGVAGYEAGEWDTEVSGTITISADGLKEDVAVPFTYTPTRDFGD
ncbi:MAG: hypothetical protein AB8H79_07450 [Myxococcota bacterium]